MSTSGAPPVISIDASVSPAVARRRSSYALERERDHLAAKQILRRHRQEQDQRARIGGLLARRCQVPISFARIAGSVDVLRVRAQADGRRSSAAGSRCARPRRRNARSRRAGRRRSCARSNVQAVFAIKRVFRRRAKLPLRVCCSSFSCESACAWSSLIRGRERPEAKERRAHVVRCGERAERHDQRDQHPGPDRDDRRRVLGAQAEQRQPLAADLMTDAVADVGDRRPRRS